MSRSFRWARPSILRIDRLVARALGGDATARREPYVSGLAQAYARGFAGCPCVFVLSTGRVGTKTLTALFELSNAVVTTHEPEPRLVRSSYEAYMEGADARADEKWRSVVLAARDSFVCAANLRGKVYVETNNRLTYLAPALAAAFPASRFIHLHRHPEEVVRSAMRRGYYERHGWDFARIRPRPGEPLAAEWDGLRRLEQCAWYWSRCNDEARAFLETLPAPRRLDLRADALFAGDEATLRRLYAFVGVEFPSRRRVERVLGKKINAGRKGQFPPASEWSDDERAAVRRFVSTTAAALGYSL